MARKQVSNREAFTVGLIKQNPTFVQFLGMCPTLAVTAKVSDAIGMGGGVIFVLVLSNLVISLIRNIVPKEIRIPVFIVVIAFFVTVLERLLFAYVEPLYSSLGVFLSLIVVNCLILGRAEAFASKNTPVKSILDGLGMGLGFTGGITLIAIFRELLGSGSLTLWQLSQTSSIGVTLIPEQYTIPLLVAPAGAFLVFGILVSQVNKLKNKNLEGNEVV